MADESDPPRKFYGLKPKDFECVNDGRTAAEMPVPARDPVDQRSVAGTSIDAHELARVGSANVPLLTGNSATNRDNDVHTMLRENVARANEAGLNDLAPKKRRRSKRTRDYLTLLAGVNGGIAAVVLLQGPNAGNVIFGLGGIAMFTAGLSWIMFQVMDDY